LFGFDWEKKKGVLVRGTKKKELGRGKIELNIPGSCWPFRQKLFLSQGGGDV